MLSCLGSLQCLGYLTYPAFFLASFFITPPGKAVSDKLAFDFNSLITALDTYVTNYNKWDSHHRDLAWLNVGKAQRDVPVHIANEYCRPDRSFEPRPEFNETTLPRVLTFDNFCTDVKSWFPLLSSSSGLGFEFGLSYGGGLRPSGSRCLRTGRPCWRTTTVDLMAVRHLDEVRTADLTQSREILDVPIPDHGLGL